MMNATANQLDQNMKVEDEEKWSQLPQLLIWMIKDRLSHNLVDDVHLASVCKHWKAASESCPQKPPQQMVSAPWLMQRMWDETKTEFLNVSTNERIILDLPEFNYAAYVFLFSRQGWLLFRQGRSVVLLNPHTDTRIKMSAPIPRECVYHVASFSALNDGTPQCVVFAGCNYNATSMVFYIANVDDESWKKHSYENGRRTEATSSLVIHGHKIYHLDYFGGLIIFDMVNHVWKEVAGLRSASTNPVSWMVESEEGKLLKIDRGLVEKKTFSFFKLNDSQTGWEELSHKDVEDRSWYLLERNYQFTVKDISGGKGKLYELTKKLEFCSHNLITIIMIHDLIDNRFAETYTPNIRFDEKWVDLGPIYKKPRSCVWYVPPRHGK